MSEFSTIMAIIASRANLPPSQVELVNRKIEELENIKQSVDGWQKAVSPDPYFNFMRFKQAEGEVLPHECASIFFAPDDPTNTISTGVWTQPGFYDLGGATWSKGLEIDPDQGRIYVTGLERESVLLINLYADWEYNTTGQRGIRWLADDGSSRTQFCTAADKAEPGVTTGMVGPEITHIRSLPSGHTYYYMQVYQSSGGDLDLQYGGMMIARLR